MKAWILWTCMVVNGDGSSGYIICICYYGSLLFSKNTSKKFHVCGSKELERSCLVWEKRMAQVSCSS